MAFGSLGAVSYDVVSNDKTAEGLGSANDNLRKFGTIAGGVMTGFGAAAMLAGDKVNSAYADIRIGTGATGEALEELKEDFHAVYGAIPGEAAAVSGALASLNTTTGATGDLLQGLTTNIMEVSRMLGEEGVNNAQSFGEALKQWQIPAEDGIILMDQLFKITQDTGIGFGELTNAMNAYGPVMQNAGFSAAETAELFGRLEGSGIAISRVMPGLNAAFRKWAEEGVNGRMALESTIGAIKNAETEMEALTIATEAFGAEGAQRMTTAVRNSTFELSSLGETLEDTEGLIAQTAEGTLTLSDKFGMFKARVTEVLAPLEGVGAAMTVLGPVLIVASNLHWANVVAILAHTKAVFGLIPTYATFGGALAIATIQLKLAAAAQWLMNISMYGCPLVWIVGAIAAVVTVLIILEKKFGILTTAVDILSGGIRLIADFFHGAADAIRGVVVDTDALTEANEQLIDAADRVKGAEEEVKIAQEKAEESAEDLAEASAELAKAQLEVSDAAREVDVLTEAYEELKSAMDAAAGKTEELDDLDRNLRSAQLDLLDAQDKYSGSLSGGGKNSKEAKAALEKYNEAIKDHGADSEEAANAQNKYSLAISKNTTTSRERERAAIALERAEDRVSDIQKKIKDTSEEETIAIKEAAKVQKDLGYESVGSMKEILDGKVAVLEEHSGEVEKWAAITEEKREKHEWNIEDVKRWEEVKDYQIAQMEEAATIKEGILEGEVDTTQSVMGRIQGIVEEHWSTILSIITPGGLIEAGKAAIDGFIAGIKSKKGEVGEAMEDTFKGAEKKMPHSDAEEGPFSKLTESGRSVVETFAKGIESGSGIATSFSTGIAPMAPAAASGASGGDTYGGDTISIGNVSLSRDYDFPALMKDIEAYQSQKRVQRGIRTI